MLSFPVYARRSVDRAVVIAVIDGFADGIQHAGGKTEDVLLIHILHVSYSS